MYDKIVIRNENTKQEITLGRPNAMFLLADDSAIDWGEIQSSISTFNTIGMIGQGIQNVGIDQGRTITIIGYVIDDKFGTIKNKKALLNSFVDPFGDITVKIEDSYFISGHFDSAIKYSSLNSENNDILCKFQMSIFCPNPCFKLLNSSNSLVNFGVYKKLFTLPIVWKTDEKIVMGLQQSYGEFSIYNPGTIDIGFKITVLFLRDVTGFSMTNKTTGQQFRLKSKINMKKGDKLIISSETGKKYIKAIYADSGQEKTGISLFDVSSDFVQLYPGSNEFEFSSSLGSLNFSSIEVDFDINPMYLALEGQ